MKIEVFQCKSIDEVERKTNKFLENCMECTEIVNINVTPYSHLLDLYFLVTINYRLNISKSGRLR